MGSSLTESNDSSQRSAQAAEQQRRDELYSLAGPESSGFGLKVGGNTNTGVAVSGAGYVAWAADVQAGISAAADRLKPAEIDFSHGDVVIGGRSFEDRLNDAYGPGRLANVSDLQSGASLFASRRPNNPMSLNNPDPHSIGGFVGRAISGAGSAVSEMGPLALDGLGAFANAERAGLSSDFEPKSQLGKLLADDNLTVGEKAKRIGLGALQGIADVVDGKPEAIGGALASWGAARLVASGSRATIAVDDLAAADGASRLGSRLNGSSEVTNSGPQISNLRTIRSADANAPFISDAAKAEGWYPPYADGPGVRTFTTAGDLSFVRLHTGEGNAPGGFLVRQEEIAHLRNDPAAIQNYLGLKDTPAYMSDVTVPVGTRMQVGIIGPQPNFGLYNNSGMQYQLLEQIPRSSFYNTRPLK